MMYAQESNAAARRAERKAQRDAERAKLRAEEQVQDMAAYQQAVQALKNKQFVLEANQVIFRNGMSAFVTSNTNFVLMNGNRATVQTAFNTPYPGPNGIGGVTVDGNSSDMKMNVDKKGNVNCSFSVQGIGYDLSYLEMVINVDELQIGALSVGQKVQLTADAVTDKTYVGTVTRVSMKGSSSGGTTTYPITIRIDNTDGLRPGMNANAEIVVAEAGNALVVPNAAVIRGGYVLVSKKSPSAANAVEDMDAPDGYVYVKVETGVSDDSYTEIKSGLQEDDTVAYDTSSVSDDYYSDSYSDSIW